jgi:hypothetical protein
LSTPEGQPASLEGQPTEEELRAAYEAELSRITSAEMVIQSAVSLLNLGGRRLGFGEGGEGQKDLEQVRDAIDGVRGLLPVLERRMPQEIRPLRDALSQLQMAYAQQMQGDVEPVQQSKPAEPAGPSGPAEPAPAPDSQAQGPAQASGRLWVPGS